MLVLVSSLLWYSKTCRDDRTDFKPTRKMLTTKNEVVRPSLAYGPVSRRDVRMHRTANLLRNVSLLVRKKCQVANTVSLSSCTRRRTRSQTFCKHSQFSILTLIWRSREWTRVTWLQIQKNYQHRVFPRAGLGDESIHLQRRKTTIIIQSRKGSLWILITLPHIALNHFHYWLLIFVILRSY